MSAEQVMYDTLRVSGPVTAVVGQRIYQRTIPQQVALPAIAFIRTDTEFANTIHGTVGRTKATVEVWCVAENDTAAYALADLAKLALLPARFFPIGLRPESDEEAAKPNFSAVLTYQIWE